MALALGTMAVVLGALILQLASVRLARRVAEWHARRRRRMAAVEYDPGRELRAEQRARALLRSCVSEQEWKMYRDLGFIRVWGALRPTGPRPRPSAAARMLRPRAESAPPEAEYAYLVYPHRPIVAYLPQTGELLSEYCVAFPDRSEPYGSTRLPASDDVLAKWMALRADERRLIAAANMHLPGRQVDPAMVRSDLARLARWERERIGDSMAVAAAM